MLKIIEGTKTISTQLLKNKMRNFNKEDLGNIIILKQGFVAASLAVLRSKLSGLYHQNKYPSNSEMTNILNEIHK